MSITELPNELITAICDHLPECNLFSIRQSCSRLEQATAKPFSKRYYEDICILITSRNLEFLRFVAGHETLRHSVRAIYIFPGLWESWKDLKLESFDYYNGRKSREMVPPKLAQDRYDAYRQILDDHLALVTDGGLQQCLNEVLGRFPNLDSAGLRHRSVKTDGRYEPLRCIDWLEIKRRTGQDPSLPPDDTHTAVQEYTARTKVLVTLIAAAAANNIRLNQLTSCSGECGSLGPFWLDLTQPSSVLRHIRDLHLCWTWFMKTKEVRKTNAREELMKATSASVETLHWGTISQNLGCNRKAIAPEQRLATGTDFQRLTELKISTVLVALDTLPAILCSTRSTLQKLALSEIQIGRTRSAIEGSVRWRRVFDLISEHHHLRLVDLAHLGHAGIYWKLVDPVHRSQGSNSLTNRAVWELSTANVNNMTEWINSVHFDIRPGDAYSTVNPGSYIFGKDVKTDAWVRNCLDKHSDT